jgi:hypothetical protein
MIQNDSERFYFNQNLIYHKDKIYNSGGSLEISICSSTTDYKTFSSPTLHISIIGENNLRRLCSLNLPDSVDLYSSCKDVIQNVETIYETHRNNTIIKRYQFDRMLKFEFLKLQGSGDRVVIISVIHSNSDFAKVIVPYAIFCSFAIGILKYFVNDFVNISFNFSTRNLLTELLEQNKMIKNGIQVLPSMLIESYERGGKLESSSETSIVQPPNDIPVNTQMESTLEDFDKFLGKDMENIDLPDLKSKAIIEEKPQNIEVKNLFIEKTLTKDLSVLESMITATITRPDPLIALMEGFRRSMNLDESITFLPGISKNDLKSALYLTKVYHDTFFNMYINNTAQIPSSFTILKYQIPKNVEINNLNISLAYDLLLIFGFIKLFRSRMESREADANKNGSIFYMRLRTFLDILVYPFLDISKAKSISNTVYSNFEKYNQFGFFNHYQKILSDNKFEVISLNDIREFCEELHTKILTNNLTKINNIHQRHEELFKNGFLRIKSDNNLSIEQIINELVPLEVYEKLGINLKEGSEELNKAIQQHSISIEITNIFLRKEPRKEQVSNLVKTIKFYNNEIPEKYRNEFFEYIEKLKFDNFDFYTSKYDVEELGDNIIKSLYIWNESDNKSEPLTTYRLKLEECILTKNDILSKYKNTEPLEVKEEIKTEEEWSFNLE